ncbi:hypothetical protein D9758_000504 [Tetrapyrgos nigripes]|uniref:Uncharacterized protein n=1 Tax=Tetrapyrgos nigripes TaxID=182062 RepID=A0A8H5H1G0_9AGAR|nr:hypothetical protein D9758_000504 [Tetrapyrgos nigripes]
MLALSTLHTLLSQVLSLPDLHTAILHTPGGHLVSYASDPSRSKDDIHLVVGVSWRIWQDTQGQGYLTNEGELGRVIVLPIDEPEEELPQPLSEDHQPLMLLTLNATDSVDWEELRIKGTALATHFAKTLCRFRAHLTAPKPPPASNGPSIGLARNDTYTCNLGAVERWYKLGAIGRDRRAKSAGPIHRLKVAANVVDDVPRSMQPWSLSTRRKVVSQNFFVTRYGCRRHGVLVHNKKPVAQQLHPTTVEIPVIPCRPDPYVLLARELSQLRNNLSGLLGSAHPALSNIAQHYYLHPSQQLRPLVVLLFARATNGLAHGWEEKKWIAHCEHLIGRDEELNQPLTRAGVLNNWNPNMPDHTASFDSLFPLQTPKIQPTLPPLPDSSAKSHDTFTLANPPTILPSQFRLAQLVEMIHIASSFHDQVIDRTFVAKNSPSTKDTMGNKLAILGGDFLLGRASCTLSRLGDDEVVELIASVISNIVEGTIWRMKNVPSSHPIPSPSNPDRAWRNYFNRIYLEHASLLAKGARGAVILGGSREGEILKEVAYAYGRHLGLANQLTKDTVDYEATEGQFDRPEDEASQADTPTGPLLYAWEDHPELGPLILRNFSNSGDAEHARHLIRVSSGVERTRALARTHAEKARKLLYLLPRSDTRDALEELTERVVEQTW